ncbi:hypothetical protein [Paenarthrobacter sp. TA1.8]|uniref:hypothetical protein n=1 Tax=Paenarthrobacter sp. TA1.8 TaxID=3400219 RepID=UPI003B430421
MKITVIVALSVLAVIVTVVGIVWSNKPSVREHPDDEHALLIETPGNRWQAHRGTWFGISGAALGFAATMIALFTA